MEAAVLSMLIRVYARISCSSNRQRQAKVETRPGHPGATHAT